MTMEIVVRVSTGRVRQWMLDMVADLRRSGHAVHVQQVAARHPPALALDLLDLLERTIFGVRTTGWKRIAVERTGSTDEAAGRPDVVVDLSDAGDLRQGYAGSRIVTVDYAGAHLDEALVGALLDETPPEVSLRDGQGLLLAAVLATEDRKVLTRSLDQIGERLRHCVGRAATRPDVGAGGPSSRLVQGGVPARRLDLRRAGRLLAGLAGKIARRLDRLSRSDATWRVGVRRTSGPLARHMAFDSADFTWIQDDGGRYYADPFLFRWEGRTCLFVEEFPYATGKGILAVCDVGPDGISPPRPFMEQAGHLSYPNVFARDGEVWMIPETSFDRTISLYRCLRFPDRWEREAVLVAGVDAGDATLLDDGERLWLFASARQPGESSWDTLSLFWAPALRGPWTAHPLNPVLVDARSARPAGAVRRFADALVRPAQDCVGGYGRGLTLARIDELSPDRPFRQTIEQRIVPPATSGVTGLHTLNDHADVQVVDAILSRGISGKPWA